MEQMVYERLRQIGYTELTETDSESIRCITDNIIQELLNYCNLRKIPYELRGSLVENICGEFLKQKKVAGGGIQGIDLDSPAVKEITAGDTKTSFASGDGSSTPEQRYDALVEHLTSCGKKMWNRFRRMRW